MNRSRSPRVSVALCSLSSAFLSSFMKSISFAYSLCSGQPSDQTGGSGRFECLLTEDFHRHFYRQWCEWKFHFLQDFRIPNIFAYQTTSWALNFSFIFGVCSIHEIQTLCVCVCVCVCVRVCAWIVDHVSESGMICEEALVV